MNTHERIIRFVLKSNWVLLCAVGAAGFLLAPGKIAGGLIAGGLIVTVNFHLLSRTLRKALRPHQVPSTASLLAKYYLRFSVSGIIIFILIYWKLVDPLGLVIGLSIVVLSIVMATVAELKKMLKA